MGKQISFYQTRDDEQEFLAYVRSTGDAVLLAQTSEKELEDFQFFYELEGRKLGEACHLWNRAISPRPRIEHYPEKGYFCLDFMQSEVVNVMRSKLTNRGLSMGRLHIEDKVLHSDGSMRSKGEAFLHWFGTLSQWLKRRYKKGVGGAYMAPSVEGLIRSGVELIGHCF
jgi:hypothetical protein